MYISFMYNIHTCTYMYCMCICWLLLSNPKLKAHISKLKW